MVGPAKQSWDWVLLGVSLSLVFKICFHVGNSSGSWPCSNSFLDN